MLSKEVEVEWTGNGWVDGWIQVEEELEVKRGKKETKGV